MIRSKHNMRCNIFYSVTVTHWKSKACPNELKRQFCFFGANDDVTNYVISDTIVVSEYLESMTKVGVSEDD